MTIWPTSRQVTRQVPAMAAADRAASIEERSFNTCSEVAYAHHTHTHTHTRTHARIHRYNAVSSYMTLISSVRGELPSSVQMISHLIPRGYVYHLIQLASF